MNRTRQVMIISGLPHPRKDVDILLSWKVFEFCLQALEIILKVYRDFMP